MQADATGQEPAHSTTARPAAKGTNTRPEPALLRRTVDSIVVVTGCRRSEARERITAWQAGGRPLGDLDAYLRATFQVDPTGVTAVRNVMRAQS